MSRRSIILAASFAIACSALSPSAFADIRGLNAPPQQTVKTGGAGPKQIDGAGGSTPAGGATSTGVKSAPFDPAQVCFSSCPTPSLSGGGATQKFMPSTTLVAARTNLLR